jgi:integrase
MMNTATQGFRSVAMSENDSTTSTRTDKPAKPSPDFPLFAHATKRWAKKIKGKMYYFGRWDDPAGALREYAAFLATGKKSKPSRTASNKPSKPYPDFPLFPHATKRWAKKIRGQIHYFGPWDDWRAALDNYEKQKEALHAGRRPRPDANSVTVKDAANDFLDAKKALVETGELSERTWNDYKQVCELVVAHMGKGRLAEDVGPEDFASLRKKVAKRWGPQRLGSKLIQYTRCLFKYADDAGLIDRPVRFGPGFKRPSKKVLRLNRAHAGPKLFTACEVRRLIDAAGPSMRAMILLGINAGFGNADCGALPLSAVDFDKAVIDFPRPKTGIPRRCPLWPETAVALRDALSKRHEPKSGEDAGLFFITKYGLAWGKETSTNPVSQEMGKLLRTLHINERKGLGFYTLRHVFRTIADESKDQPGVDFIMGHEVPHMSAIYRETISDERLRAVADHVRSWLFPTATTITSVE